MGKYLNLALMLLLCLLARNAAIGEDLVVGTYAAYPPFEFLDEENRLAGFDVDLVTALGREAGFTPEWHMQAFKALLQGLETGRSDLVASALSITPSRLRNFDFTDPYYEVAQVIIFRAGDPEPQRLSEFKDRRLGVVRLSIADMTAAKEFGQEATNVVHYPTYAELVAGMADRSIDGAFVDEPYARIMTASIDGSVVGRTNFASHEYGLALKKGNEALRIRLNEALGRLRKSGELQQIREKWFKPGKNSK